VPDRLQFGLIGSGSQGRFLSEALRMTDKADLIACADPNEEATQRAIEQCGYQTAFSSAEELLDQADLDAVIVATIHDQLQPMALAAVNAGKHVFVEKPMALNAADGRELVAAATEANVRLMVGYTLRFMPERMLMKQLLDEGAIGDISHAAAGQCIGFSSDHWLNDPQHGGGPLFYIGSHALDNALWMIGREPTRIFADVYWPDKTHAEAGVDALISFADGLCLHACASYRSGCSYGWLDLIGTEGRMRSEWQSNKLYIESRNIPAYNQPTELAVPLQPYIPPLPGSAAASVVTFRYLPMWAAEMHEFIDAITAGREPSVTGADGVRFLEVADAIFASARTGQPVRLT
jgi:predicted dehydrogenase